MNVSAPPVSPTPLTRSQRFGLLAAAFLSWMFSGLGISLFILIHRQMTLGLLGIDTPEQTVTRWFTWYQAAFLFGAAVGGWLFGWLGDRIGRTKSMGLSAAILGLPGNRRSLAECRRPCRRSVARWLATVSRGTAWSGSQRGVRAARRDWLLLPDHTRGLALDAISRRVTRSAGSACPVVSS